MKNSFPGESKSCPSESEPCPNESESCPNESGSCPSESKSCPSGSEPFPSESEPFPSESESGRDHYIRIPQTICLKIYFLVPVSPTVKLLKFSNTSLVFLCANY